MSVDELSNIQLVVLLFSNYSPHSRHLFDSIPESFRKFYRPLCVDHSLVRLHLPIKYVPCIVILYKDGQIARYEGKKAFEVVSHMHTLLSSLPPPPPPSQSQSPSRPFNPDDLPSSHSSSSSAGTTPISSLLPAPPPSMSSPPQQPPQPSSSQQQQKQSPNQDYFRGDGPRESFRPPSSGNMSQGSEVPGQRPDDLPARQTKINVADILTQADDSSTVQRNKIRASGNFSGMNSDRNVNILQGEGHSSLGKSSLNMANLPGADSKDQFPAGGESFGESIDDLMELDASLDPTLKANIGKKGNISELSQTMAREKEAADGFIASQVRTNR